MSRRRRAVLLLGLATLLGGLSAASVHRREVAVGRALGPSTFVLVTSAPVRAGARLAAARPVLRALPRRFAPPDAVTSATALLGVRAAVALPAGAYVTAAVLRSDAAGGTAGVTLGPGERVAELVAHGDPAAVVPGAHVDVLVTHEPRAAQPGATVLALADVEVLAATAAPAGTAGDGTQEGGARVAVSLRVSVHQALYLAAAQSFARDLRLLVRAPGDRGGVRPGLAVDDRLR